MARGSFLSRIGKTLTGIGKGLAGVLGFGERGADIPPPPPEPLRSPPPPPPGPPGGGRGAPPRFTQETQIWQDITTGDDRFNADLTSEWFDLYRNSVDPLELDEPEFYHFWGQFLRAFYLVSGERGSLSRDAFYRELGVRKRDFGMDWQEWRELKRGTP